MANKHAQNIIGVKWPVKIYRLRPRHPAWRSKGMGLRHVTEVSRATRTRPELASDMAVVLPWHATGARGGTKCRRTRGSDVYLQKLDTTYNRTLWFMITYDYWYCSLVSSSYIFVLLLLKWSLLEFFRLALTHFHVLVAGIVPLKSVHRWLQHCSPSSKPPMSRTDLSCESAKNLRSCESGS